MQSGCTTTADFGEPTHRADNPAGVMRAEGTQNTSHGPETHLESTEGLVEEALDRGEAGAVKLGGSTAQQR